MVKNIIAIIIFTLLTSVVFAQHLLKNGDSQLNLGLGLSSWGVPLYVGFDYGVHPDISIGGELSYQAYNEKWKDNTYSHTILGISGNGNYHFNRIMNIADKWDLYGGLNLGFYVWSSPDTYKGSHSSGIGLGAQIGGRYYFSEKVGINLEFGGGNAFSGGKIGVSIKL